MKIVIKRGEDDVLLHGESSDLNGVRELLFEAQKYTEAEFLIAEDQETGEAIARLEFEWIEGEV